MKLNAIGILVILIGIATISGCAAYRTTSNIKSEPTQVIDTSTHVLISEGNIQNKKYEEIGPIEVSIKKATLFHADPTKEQANEALSEKARLIGVDAVINVTYESGIGFTTWGYIDAKGIGIKFTE